MNPHYITKQSDLDAFCLSFLQNKPEILCVDTEFVRKTTYWPKLCLIQLGFKNQIVLVDPLPERLDLSPLEPIFLDNDILKIFHAARQDLEVFYKLWNTVPQAIADTQILAMVCGFGESISYDKLSEALLGKKIDKSQQHTDWAGRPLSPKQIQYAMGDVEWLELLYEKLIEKAGKKRDYIQEELDTLKNSDIYIGKPENAWTKVKIHTPHKPEAMGRLKELAAVRERYAQAEDKPRTHIMKDEMLTQLALKNSFTAQHLEALGIKDRDLRNALLEALTRATPFPQGKNKHKQNGLLVEMLSLLLKSQAETHGIASKLIATREKIDLFLEDPKKSPLMQGWRFDLFGDMALKIKEGEGALAFDPHTKELIFVKED